jgi:4-diphosphocytidyl-2-C-methyl-D-erythritol kinase
VISEAIEAASAKVNLYLHVIGRRADGYHLLDSLAVFPPVSDVLSAEPADKLSLRIEGPFAAGLTEAADNNLVLRAARALAAESGHGAGAAMVLRKNLPVASGIGGGSADAAAALRLLGRLWGTASDASQRVTAKLGADVPVCLASRASRMSGVGEVLEPAPVLPPCGIALVNPGVAVATPDVFRARHGAWSMPAKLPEAWPDAAAMAADLTRLRNDLELPAMTLQPVIADVLAALKSTPLCLLARMSGSGATCFALYSDAVTAQQAVQQLQRPGWWCWAGPLNE